ncbi:MAG: ATP-dependent zinc metalloprotease FtsH, partial [Candidatus Pacebacteria bacterium]|nr:ATP-dependent zinc metalloprotease FtsH [Candidatus Paceibacterota bacterium]
IENIKEITIAGNNILLVFQDGTKAKARKEPETGLIETLKNYGVSSESLQKINIKTEEEKGAWVASALVIFLPIIILVFLFFLFFRQMRSSASQAFNFTKARAKLFGAEGHSKEKIGFDDVAGLKEAKEELKEIVDFLKNPQKYLKMGAKIPRGVLLLGAAGVGKTLLARAVAGEAKVPFFSISGSEFVEMFVGVGSSRVRDLFSTAKKAAPSIIFIDELDAIGRHRGTGIGGGHDEREQTLNQILVEMDGFERETNVIIMAATNRGDVLDPALLRPGRFDRKIVLDPPDVIGREEVLKIHTKAMPLASNVILKEIAERTPGFSGADIANVANEAAILAARKNKEKIFQEEFLESIEKVLLGPERKSHILSKKEKEIAAYHEAGHALVATLLPGGDPIRKISIIARGMAAGYTIHLPSEEKRMKNKEEFENELAMLLGGYCAERLVFKQTTTGGSNDLARASEIARKLVKEYGMSCLGPVVFGEKEEMVFLGKEISEQRNYSEEIAAKIDQEVDRFIKQAEKKATKVLKANKNILEKIAKTLIEKETIEKEEFESLIKKQITKPKIKIKELKGM